MPALLTRPCSAPKSLGDPVYGRNHILLMRDICRIGFNPCSPGLLTGCPRIIQRVGIKVDQCKLAATCSKSASHGCAESPTGAGNDDYFVIQVHLSLHFASVGLVSAQGASDLSMNSYLTSKKSGFCVANLRSSPATTCNWRLESGSFRQQSTLSRTNQRFLNSLTWRNCLAHLQ